MKNQLLRFSLKTIVLAAAGVIGTPMIASAVSITFDSLPTGNFTGSYAEKGFVVSPFSGTLTNNQRNGTDSNTLENTESGGPNAVVRVVEATGADFTFLGVDTKTLAGPTPSFAIFVTGLLNGVQQYGYTLPAPDGSGSFVRQNSGQESTLIDDLRFTLGVGSGFAAESIDNIEVISTAQPVPEPSTMGGLTIGLGFGAFLKNRYGKKDEQMKKA